MLPASAISLKRRSNSIVTGAFNAADLSVLAAEALPGDAVDDFINADFAQVVDELSTFLDSSYPPQ
jgi:hypothetical protein